MAPKNTEFPSQPLRAMATAMPEPGDLGADMPRRSGWLGGLGFEDLTRADRMMVALAVAAHLAVTGYLAWALNIWVDEAFSLETSGHGLWHAVERAIGFELQPPLYFALLSLWRVFDDGIFWARLLSMVFTTGAILAMVPVSRVYVPSVSPGLVALVFALNPFTVWAAVEIRPYAMIILLSCLLLLAFERAYLGPQRNTRWAVAHAALAVLALYTQHYLGFLLFAQGAALLILRRWRLAGSYLVTMATVACVASPILWAAIDQTAQHRPRTASDVSVVDAPLWAYRRLRDYLLPQLTGSFREWQLRAVRAAAIPAALVLLAAFRASRGRRWPTALCGTFIVSFGVHMATAVALGPSNMEPRHTAGVFPLVVLIPISLLETAGWHRATRLWFALAVSLALAGLVSTYAGLAKRGDFRRVAEFLTRQANADQPVIVFGSYHALALTRHYAGPSRVYPLPRPAPLDRFDPTDYVLPSENELHNVLALVSTPGGAWLVDVGDTGYLGVDFHRERLERVLEKCFAITSQERFFGSTVSSLELRFDCERLSHARSSR